MGLRYDGYFHIPELLILLPPPIVKNVDVHGFGNEDIAEIPGILHGVVGMNAKHVM